MKTVKEIANIVTNVNDGSLKKGVWTTKLAEEINTGRLVIPDSQETVSIQYDGKSFPVAVNVLALRSLFEAARGSMTYPALLGIMSEDCLSSQQANKSGDDSTPFAHPLSNQTSDRQEWQYLQIRFGDQQQVATIVELLLTDTSKMKLSELQKHFEEVVECIYPESERLVVQTMQENERKAQEKFTNLLVAGYENIRQIKGGGWSAIVSPAPAATIRDTLAVAGFRLVGNTKFDPESGKLAITFDELEKTVDEPLA